MRITLTSRIFSPEPSAASFRLAAMADALDAAGHSVTVLTSTYSTNARSSTRPGVRVRRARVLRDRAGYVRGYAQYLSFDIPLFFRLLCAGGADVVVTEPPPTTGAIVRVASWLRRTPYVYYAADIWSDAAEATGAPAWVLRGVRSLELFALRGASAVLSVSEGVSLRLSELGVSDRVHLVGNGVDTDRFGGPGPEPGPVGGRYLVYAGTASEVHGASIFLNAFAEVIRAEPDARLVFIGQGSERGELEHAARALPVGAVRFEPRLPPETVAGWLRGAVASLASVRPGQGYDFSFPTKMYASAACGTPVIYAGVGPGRDFARGELGEAVEYDVPAVAGAMRRALAAPPSPARRAQIRGWAVDNVDLTQVAERGRAAIEKVVTRRP